MAKYVGFVTIGTDQSMPIAATLYGVCGQDIAIGANPKLVTLDALTNITAGVTVRVKFINGNNNNDLKLTFTGMPSDTTGIAVKNYGAGSSLSFAANSVISFTYDGINWVMHDANTTYSTLDQTTVNTGTETTGKLVTAKIIKDTVTNAINGLDVSNITSKLGADKTITALSETNGKIAATASNIAITEGQVSQLSSGGWIAPLSSPDLTGTPTAPTANAGTNTTQIATTAFVVGEINSKLASNDAMLFKGTLGTGGTITTVPASGYQAGWTYRIVTAGTYAGIKCEVGDLLIAIKDGPSSGSSITNADWTVAQTNIDGAVTSTGGTFGSLAKFNGTNSIVDGPAFTTSYDSSTAVTTSHKFLREDGTWMVPKYTTNAAGYGKITVSAQSSATTGLTGQDSATTPTAKSANETLKFTTSNKWIVITGTNSSTANADEIKFAHAVPASITNSAPSAAQTGVRGSTFNIPKIIVDTAGHVTALESITVSLPASDNTDEKLEITDTNPTSLTTYYPIFGSGTTAATRSYNDGLQYITKEGTTSAAGDAILKIGNNLASTTAKNKTGRIRIYGDSTTYLDIMGTNTSSNYTITLPKITANGNLVGTSTTSAVGNGKRPVYIAANGIATAMDYTFANSLTTINYLSDANYVKTAEVTDGVLTITKISNASSITVAAASTAS